MKKNDYVAPKMEHVEMEVETPILQSSFSDPSTSFNPGF